MASIIVLNPDNLAPQEVVENIVALDVEYVDFEGNRKAGVVEIHKDLAEDLRQFFILALARRFPIEKVVKSSDNPYFWDDNKLVAANTSSGFNYRSIKDTTKPSLHGLGRAIDINTRLNPYIRFIDDGIVIDPEGAVYEPGKPGVLTPDDPLVIFMKERGWEWGGDWLPESGRTDYQHFQKLN